MAVKEVTEKFETSDGRKFKSKQQADKHEELIAAREQYETAKSRYNHALLQSQKTADGFLFKVGIFDTYYYIHPNDFGLPALRELPYLGWNFEVDERDKVTIRHLEGERFAQYRIDELYASKWNATVALLAAQKERLAEYAEQVAELELKIGEQGESK